MADLRLPLQECIAEVLQEFSIEEDPRSYTLLVKRGDAYVRLSNAQCWFALMRFGSTMC